MVGFPVRTSDFTQIRRSGQHYVDKTAYIKNAIDPTHNRCKIILRPPQFGKSLFLNMLECFLAKEKQTAEGLFDGLAISDDKDFIGRHQGRYTVIRFSMKEVIGETYQHIQQSLQTKFADLYRNYYRIRDKLQPIDQQYFDEVYDQSKFHPNALIKLSEFVLEYNKKEKVLLIHQKPFIFVDGYDTALIAAENMGEECLNKTRAMIKAVITPLLNTENISFNCALIMGVTALIKESSHCDHIDSSIDILQNTRVFSTTFGFTRDEIAVIPNIFEYPDIIERLTVYAGYYFCDDTFLYHPGIVAELLNNVNTPNANQIKLHVPQYVMDNIIAKMNSIVSASKTKLITLFNNNTVILDATDTTLNAMLTYGCLSILHDINASETTTVFIPNEEAHRLLLEACRGIIYQHEKKRGFIDRCQLIWDNLPAIKKKMQLFPIVKKEVHFIYWVRFHYSMAMLFLIICC